MQRIREILSRMTQGQQQPQAEDGPPPEVLAERANQRFRQGWECLTLEANERRPIRNPHQPTVYDQYEYDRGWRQRDADAPAGAFFHIRCRRTSLSFASWALSGWARATSG